MHSAFVGTNLVKIGYNVVILCYEKSFYIYENTFYGTNVDVNLLFKGTD